MRIINAKRLSGFARKSAESVSDFASVVRNLILDVRDSYRPEVHYMRGRSEMAGHASVLVKVDFRSRTARRTARTVAGVCGPRDSANLAR